ncbi:MAG: MFS transporter [Bacteroidetes bacterium]|nr:MAG: MFS transporter [Bacteroidota bacterium]
MEEYNPAVKKAVIISATLSSFLTPFMASSINIALPTIGREFGMSAIFLSWVASTYLLTAAMFLVPFGKIADIYGRKKVFLLGLIIYTASALFCAFSLNGYMIIIGRIIQGIGGAMIFGTGVSLVTSVVPANERGKIIGITISMVYVGLSLGPFLGGVLTHNFGWRSVFIFNIPLGSIAIYYVMFKLKGEWAEAKGEKLDYYGSVIYGLSLLMLMYGLSQLPKTLGFILVSAGLAGIVFFIIWEMKIDNPVLNMNLFRNNTVFAMSNLAALINYSATFAITFLLSFYLQYIKLLTPQGAGVILVTQPIVMAIFAPISGRLSDKIESRIIASIGMGLTVIGLILLTLLNEQSGKFYIITCLIILGLGFGLFSSPNTNAVMSSVERKYLGIASATVSTMRLIGQMLSMGIAMLVIAIMIGNVQIKPAYHAQLMSSMKIIFTIFVVLCTIGIFASLARGKHL